MLVAWWGVPRDSRPAWEAALVAMASTTKAPAWLLGRSLAGRAGRGIGWRARRPLAHTSLAGREQPAAGRRLCSASLGALPRRG